MCARKVLFLLLICGLCTIPVIFAAPVQLVPLDDPGFLAGVQSQTSEQIGNLLSSESVVLSEVIEETELSSYSYLEIEGCSVFIKPGQPLVSMKNMRFAFPGYHANVSVNIHPSSLYEGHTETSLLPAHEEVTWSAVNTQTESRRVPDPATYSTCSWIRHIDLCQIHSQTVSFFDTGEC